MGAPPSVENPLLSGERVKDTLATLPAASTLTPHSVSGATNNDLVLAALPTLKPFSMLPLFLKSAPRTHHAVAADLPSIEPMLSAIFTDDFDANDAMDGGGGGGGVVTAVGTASKPDNTLSLSMAAAAIAEFDSSRTADGEFKEGDRADDFVAMSGPEVAMVVPVGGGDHTSAHNNTNTSTNTHTNSDSDSTDAAIASSSTKVSQGADAEMKPASDAQQMAARLGIGIRELVDAPATMEVATANTIEPTVFLSELGCESVEDTLDNHQEVDGGTVRVFDISLHSRMPLVPTPARLKRACV
jgi:hypothetical protein